jgi:queuine tRNA-ribosyltransferase
MNTGDPHSDTQHETMKNRELRTRNQELTSRLAGSDLPVPGPRFSISSSTTPAFTVLAHDGQARSGRLVTAHGPINTPAFMPVATQATVKGLSPAQLREAGATIVLANAYHLALRPGTDLIRTLGGLHRFMGWDGPILTDSGGYQIFSLAALRTVTDHGVEFRSHLDGAPMFLTPEDVVRRQVDLGTDILMVLDECISGAAGRVDAERAARRTLAWAERSRCVSLAAGQLMFAIVQGAAFADLRRQQVRALVALDFPGYAVGGLGVGEAQDTTMAVAEETVTALPAERPRYLMGMGSPADLIRCVAMGYDLFDCVLPTRNGRNGMLFTSNGPLNIRLAAHARDPQPPDVDCHCYTCRTFSRAYLRHLAVSNEMLGAQLASLHNLHFYLHLMAEMREAIACGEFGSWVAARRARMSEGTGAS